MKKGLVMIWFLMMFMIGTDTFVISPLLPALQKEFMVSNDMIGWLVSAYALGYAIFALIAGPISDGMNRKKVLIVGLVVFASATLLCGLSTSFWMMLLFRLLAGIGAAVVSPQIWASIATLSPPDKMVKYMGIATMGLGVSQAVGVPIGSYLAVSGWSIPFYVLGIFSLMLIILVIISVPNLPPQNSQTANPITAYNRLFRLPKAKNSFLAYFIFQMGGFSAFTFLGKWLADSYRLGTDGIGAVMFFLGIGNVLGSLTGNRLVQKWGRQKTFSAGMVIVMLVYITISLLPNIHFVEAYLFINFFCVGFLLPITISFLQTISPKDRGAIASLTNSVMYFATMMGSMLAGVIYASFNGFFFVALFTAICFFISMLMFRTKMVEAQQAA